MTSKSILIVSRDFFPVNSPRSFRATELAIELNRQGHSVTVLTPRHDVHQSFAEEHKIELKDLGTLKWKEIPLKGKGALLMLRRVVRRLLLWFFEYPSIEIYFRLKKALKHEGNYDALISIAIPYPIHWGVASRWKNNSKTKNIAKTWIADCGDPYMGRENDSMSPPVYFAWVEKWFMCKTDYLTVPVKTAISAYYEEFHPKIRVISQGFRFQDYDSLILDSVKNSLPVFAYGGMFIPGKRDPSELIQFLAKTDKKFEFHIYTTTPAIPLRSIPAEDDRFIIHNPMARKDFLKAISSVDFLVNFDNAGSKQIPSKLMDYTILKKPILSIQTGNLDKDNVSKFLTGDYSGRFVVADPDQYRIENVARKFVDLIKD